MTADTKFILGADPGKHGAVFLYPVEVQATKASCVAIPIAKDSNGDMDSVYLYNSLIPYKDTILAAFKEHVHAVAGNSATSMFSFGESNGCLKVVLQLLSCQSATRFPIYEVSPATWQKVAWEGTPKVDGIAVVDKKTGLIKRDADGNMVFKADPKATSFAAASRRFPDMDFIPEGCRAPHDGVIDAALIAYYGFKASGL